jgi:Tfp pilus assembly protein PilP
MTGRWQKLDKFVALQAESYWLELTRQKHQVKAELLSQLAQSNAARYSIAESSEPFDRAMQKVLDGRQNNATYEQSMRKQYYESLSGLELDEAAAVEIERQYLVSALLVAKLRQKVYI